MSPPYRLARFASSIALAVVVLTGCVSGVPRVARTADGDSPDRPERVQVREYKGKRLDSVDDFRENSIKGPQKVDIASYRLRIDGEVATPTVLTYAQVKSFESVQKVVTLNCVEGWSVDILWKGVEIGKLLERAGYDPDASVVIFHCEDGYTTSLTLEYVLENRILLAYQMNGIDLPTERGYPFQVVAQNKWGYKWAKWVTRIEVSDDAEYKGYWEQRGYDNTADHNEGL